MIRQYLPNNNEKSYSAVLQKFLHLNQPLVSMQDHAFSPAPRTRSLILTVPNRLLLRYIIHQYPIAYLIDTCEIIRVLALFVSLKSQAKKYCSLICYERKILCHG
jgi:hypothetical protein